MDEKFEYAAYKELSLLKTDAIKIKGMLASKTDMHNSIITHSTLVARVRKTGVYTVMQAVGFVHPDCLY